MGNKGCTFIDEIFTQPIKGSVMRFHARTENDIQYFSMERSTAVKVAHEILRTVSDADSADRGKLVALKPASHQAAALGE